ncbi:hypothetical protein ACQY0O_001966 [Thecaphora frezii]
MVRTSSAPSIANGTHAGQASDLLVHTRARRSTAGNRMKALLDQELERDELFQEVENDVDFEEQDEQDIVDSDFDRESSDEREGADSDDDEAGERMLEEEERAQKKAKRARAVPAQVRRPAIRAAPPKATLRRTATDERGDNDDNDNDDNEDTKAQDRAKRRRISFAPAQPSPSVATGESDVASPTPRSLRTSSRRATVQNKLEVEEKIREAEERRAALPVRHGPKKRPQLTQDALIAEALEVEEMNRESLKRFLQQEEERKAKARVRKERIEGPFVRWVSIGLRPLVVVQPAEEPPTTAEAVPAAAVPAAAVLAAAVPADDSKSQRDGKQPAQEAEPQTDCPTKPIRPNQPNDNAEAAKPTQQAAAPSLDRAQGGSHADDAKADGKPGPTDPPSQVCRADSQAAHQEKEPSAATTDEPATPPPPPPASALASAPTTAVAWVLPTSSDARTTRESSALTPTPPPEPAQTPAQASTSASTLTPASASTSAPAQVEASVSAPASAQASTSALASQPQQRLPSPSTPPVSLASLTEDPAVAARAESARQRALPDSRTEPDSSTTTTAPKPTQPASEADAPPSLSHAATAPSTKLGPLQSRTLLSVERVPEDWTWEDDFRVLLGNHCDWSCVPIVPARNRPLRPRQSICPITGLPALYRDPRTGIAYANAKAYKVITEVLHGRFLWTGSERNEEGADEKENENEKENEDEDEAKQQAKLKSKERRRAPPAVWGQGAAPVEMGCYVQHEDERGAGDVFEKARQKVDEKKKRELILNERGGSQQPVKGKEAQSGAKPGYEKAWANAVAPGDEQAIMAAAAQLPAGSTRSGRRAARRT